MSIALECHRCGRHYHVKNERIGQTLRCRVCGALMKVPLPNGGQIYRHSARNRPAELVKPNPERIREIKQHIERYIGPVSFDIHERVSDLVHIQVHVVRPSSQRPYTTLVTSGMSERPMNTPDAEARQSQFAELMLCLPDTWPVDPHRFDDESVYWPIRGLKTLARFPHEYGTWFGPGHTIPNGDPPQPFATGTQLCCWLLAAPQTTSPAFSQLFEVDRQVNFYAIVPLYREEMDCKLLKGAARLQSRLSKYDVTELLDPSRRNVCKAR